MTFKVGDRVSVIRCRHGWHDGAVQGKIIESYGGNRPAFLVVDDDGDEYEINYARDIRKVD